MPELPEVETIKRVLEPQIKGLKIMNITVEKPEVISRPLPMNFVICLSDSKSRQCRAEVSF